MTAIKAECETCGTVKLLEWEIALMLCNVIERSYYRFICPTCGLLVEKSADPRIITLLLQGGVTANAWEIPLEALEEHNGEPFTYDDLLDFALFLGTM